MAIRIDDVKYVDHIEKQHKKLMSTIDKASVGKTDNAFFSVYALTQHHIGNEELQYKGEQRKWQRIEGKNAMDTLQGVFSYNGIRHALSIGAAVFGGLQMREAWRTGNTEAAKNAEGMIRSGTAFGGVFESFNMPARDEARGHQGLIGSEIGHEINVVAGADETAALALQQKAERSKDKLDVIRSMAGG